MSVSVRKFINALREVLALNSFRIRHRLLGFDAACAFLMHVDKIAVQAILSEYGAVIGKGCDIETYPVFHNCEDFTNLKIGRRCHIGKACFFDLKDRIVLSDNVTVSMRCTFITHTDLGKSQLRLKYPATPAQIRIGKNCYIGANTTILSGVQIADNCVVAAGSVVTKSFPPASLIAGVPAVLKKTIENPQSKDYAATKTDSELLV